MEVALNQEKTFCPSASVHKSTRECRIICHNPILSKLDTKRPTLLQDLVGLLGPSSLSNFHTVVKSLCALGKTLRSNSHQSRLIPFPPISPMLLPPGSCCSSTLPFSHSRADCPCQLLTRALDVSSRSSSCLQPCSAQAVSRAVPAQLRLILVPLCQLLCNHQLTGRKRLKNPTYIQ